MFAVNQHQNHTLSETGIAFMVLMEDEQTVSGIRICMDHLENFQCPISDFEHLVNSKVLEKTEKPPKYVFNFFKDQFEQNKKHLDKM